MTPSQTPRMHWSDQQQQRHEQHQTQQQPAPQLPLERAAADDIIDRAEACGGHAQQGQWRHIWELASVSYLDRRHRVLWRLLHGASLMYGAHKAYIGRATSGQANCPFMLYRPQSAVCSSNARLQPKSLMPPLASYDRISAGGLSCQLVGGRHNI